MRAPYWMFCLVPVLFLLFLSGPGRAAFTGGDCIACHASFSTEKDSLAEPPKYDLSNLSCVNCHSSTTVETVGVVGGTIPMPAVNNAIEPLRPLSGGNFYYVKNIGDKRGHNVDGIVPPDMFNRGVPPGYMREKDPSSIGFRRGKLYCAGASGCHGDRDIPDPMDAIMGSHHSDDNPVDGSTTAKSFRYLKNTREVRGVSGLEVRNWGRDRTPEEHSEYDDSINSLCASCHGAFLTDSPPLTPTGMGTGMPWKIHPVGIPLPDRGEFRFYNPDVPPASYNSDERIYSLDAPVGRPELPAAPSKEVVPGKDRVICLSCHYAHAGPYRFNLRWDYDAIFAGEKGEGGCFICHTAKRKKR